MKVSMTIVFGDKRLIHLSVELIQRLFDIADQLEHRSNLMAMEALRNLIIQAFLIDKQEYADMILGQGFFALLE